MSRSGKQTSLQEYIRINGQPYVIEENADQHGIHSQLTGYSRYIRDNYYIFTAAILGRLYEKVMKVSIFGSHPPGEPIYREDLMNVLLTEDDQHFTTTESRTTIKTPGG